MKILIFFLIFCFFFGAAQNNNEKLFNDYKTYKKQDTIRCNILLKMIDYVSENTLLEIYNQELLIITAKEVKTTTNKILFDYYELNYAIALSNASNLLTWKNEHKKAIVLANKALSYHLRLKMADEVSSDYCVIAINNQSLGNDEIAVLNFKKSIQAAKKGKDVENLLTSLHNLSILYGKQSKYKDAIELQFEILKISERINNQIYIGDCLTTIGAFYYELNDINKSIAFNNRSLKFHQKANNKVGVALSNYQLGNIEQSKKNYDQALNFFFQCKTPPFSCSLWS